MFLSKLNICKQTKHQARHVKIQLHFQRFYQENAQANINITEPFK